MAVQSPSAVVLVRPHHFNVNPVTAADNAFQKVASAPAEELARSAYREVTGLAEALTEAGVRVHLFEDETEERPDSVFPNNWLSTHIGGHVAVYPMFAPNRRLERRQDILELLKATYRVQDIIDYSGLEHDGIFLEGTGAMVLDNEERVAYVARSNRADPIALERFCTNFGYEPMVFDAADPSGTPIYHTNVLMCIGTDFVLAGTSMMQPEARRAEIVERLSAGGREVIDLAFGQIADFAGNAIELVGSAGRILALSRRAADSLRTDQLAIIERSCTVLAVDVPTIELSGGSVRCMIAGIHLTPRR
ncbi:MAG TPA: arginine deiminase-related protein [Terrimesophilobacter sp.]|uniref:citrulline utilization hydrolase CtlX n=1 Tax=Terrimesophilobacter sp. TaxID=2906435 RepID=UPI002F94E6B0